MIDVERDREYIILRDRQNRKQVTDQLIALKKELGYIPGKTEFRNKIPGGKKLYAQCYRHFYGIEDACKAAGIENHRLERQAVKTSHERQQITAGLMQAIQKTKQAAYPCRFTKDRPLVN